MILLVTALSSLAAAGAGWVRADTEQREKQHLADNYSSYIKDTMQEEEDTAAMERSLQRCMGMLREAQR